MFQTELHLALQSFATDGLTLIMRIITSMGYEQFTISVLIIVVAGLSFRKGFLLFQIIVWTGIFTDLAKNYFALPRPFWVDSRVLDLETGKPNLTPFTGMGARTFFGLPPADVIEALRGSGKSYGFPSGHTTVTVSVWGGLAVVYRKRILYWIFPTITILMMLSRLYLGRHFLADVLGGAALACTVLVAAHSIFDRYGWREKLFDLRNLLVTLRSTNVILLFLLFILPLVAYSVSALNALVAGYVMGLNAAYYLFVHTGIPDDTAPAMKRIARVTGTAIIFFGMTFLLRRATIMAGLDLNHPAAELFITAVPSFLAFWGGGELWKKIGWYRP